MRSISQVLLFTMLAGGTAMADMRIELTDGRIFTVPYGADEIRRIVVDGRTVRLIDAAAAAAASEAAPSLQGQLPPRPAPLAVGNSLDEAGRRILRVGPERELRLPSDASAIAVDGDIIEIDAGRYVGDVTGWKQNDLVIRAVGGPVHIDAAGRGHAGKGLWVISGHNVTIEGIEMSNCAVDDNNCAAIRAEGGDLTLRDMHLHHNQMGLLSAMDFEGRLLIDRSEINDNGVDYEALGIQPGHNIYMGAGGSLVVQGSWIHNPVSGHNIKSRSAETLILYNRIEDGDGGHGSYQIDISDGGRTVIQGNLIRQGPLAENYSIIAYGSETRSRANSSLELIHNTVVNELGNGIFLRNDTPVVASLVNNAFLGEGELAVGATREVGNVRTGEPMEPADILRRGFGMDKGVQPGSVEDFTELPAWEYAHPVRLEKRPLLGAAPDAGAFEMTGPDSR